MKYFLYLILIFSFSFSNQCDINNDESQDIIDIVIMVNSILNEQETSCDLNGDDLINIIDVIQLIQLILYGMNIEFINIPNGQISNPLTNNIETIDYDFEIGKYEITNQQYLIYLNQAITVNNIWVDDCIDNIGDMCVNGYYYFQGQYIEKSFFILGNPYDYMLKSYNFGIITYNQSEFFIENELYLDHPVVNVSWYGANDFAKFYNLRLPYYSEVIRSSRANSNTGWPITGVPYNTMYLAFNLLNSHFNVPEDFSYLWDDGTTPVGFYNVDNNLIDNSSQFGVYDLIGNANEWINDQVTYNDDIRFTTGGGWDCAYRNSRLKWHIKYTNGEPSWSSGFRVVKDN